MLSIDITDTHIRLLKGKSSGKRIEIKKADTCGLLDGCIKNGYITDIQIVAGEIADMLVKNRIKEKNAIVCINSSSILYKEIISPRPRVQGKAAELYIEEMIRNDMALSDEYNISYTIMGEASESGTRMNKLLVTACPQDIIDSYISLFNQVGLNLKQIAISNNCISRLIRNSVAYKDSMPLLLLQVDSKFVNINLYKDGKLSLSRYIKADPADYEQSADYINLVVFDNLFRIIHFLDQDENTAPLKEIEYYGIIKDTAALQNAISQFNIPAKEIVTPPELMRKCDFDFLQYASAIGAFYKINKKTENINLLDSKEARRKKSNRNFFAAAAVVAFICLGSILGADIYSEMIKELTNNELQNITAEYKNLNYEKISRVVNIKRANINAFNTYSEKVERARALFDFQPKMLPDILDKLKNVLLPGMNINSGVSVSGYSVSASFYCPLENQPSLYTEALINQDYFENIIFSGYSMSESGDGYNFSLNMRIKGGNRFEAE